MRGATGAEHLIVAASSLGKRVAGDEPPVTRKGVAAIERNNADLADRTCHRGTARCRLRFGEYGCTHVELERDRVGGIEGLDLPDREHRAVDELQ